MTNRSMRFWEGIDGTFGVRHKTELTISEPVQRYRIQKKYNVYLLSNCLTYLL
jgi:hypothetical protein